MLWLFNSITECQKLTCILPIPKRKYKWTENNSLFFQSEHTTKTNWVIIRLRQFKLNLLKLSIKYKQHTTLE